jgi:hypothetical protein
VILRLACDLRSRRCRVSLGSTVQVVLDEQDGQREVGVGPAEVAAGLLLREAPEVVHHETDRRERRRNWMQQCTM